MSPQEINFNCNPYAPTEPKDIAQLVENLEFKEYFGRLHYTQKSIPYPTSAFDVINVLMHIKEKDFIKKYVEFKKEIGHPVSIEIVIPQKPNPSQDNVPKPDFSLRLEPLYSSLCCNGRLSTTGYEGVVILDFAKQL